MKNIVKLMVVAVTFSSTTLLANDTHSNKMDINVVLPKTVVVSELPATLKINDGTKRAQYSPQQKARLVGLESSKMYSKRMEINVVLPQAVVITETPAPLKVSKKAASAQYSPEQLANLMGLELTSK